MAVPHQTTGRSCIVNTVPQTLEEARIAGIEEYRATVTRQWYHLKLAVIGDQYHQAETAGNTWDRSAATRLIAQADIATTFLTDILGLSYRDLNAVTKDAKDAGIRMAEDMARRRGWLPALEAVA